MPFLVFIQNRNLLFQLIKRNVSSRYKGHSLGMLWTVVQPLIMLVVYTFVFSVVFKAKWGGSITESQGSYAILMFCGMTLFNLFSESVNASCQLIINNPNYVKKIIFPLEVLPVAQVLSTFTIGCGWIGLLFLGVIVVCNGLSWTALFFPLLLIPIFFFTLGLSYLVSSVTVYLRDVQYFVAVILQILFFLTPIFYPIEAVPSNFRVFLKLNPLTSIIENARGVLVYEQILNFEDYFSSVFISFIVFYLGFVWFNKTKKGFADVL